MVGGQFFCLVSGQWSVVVYFVWSVVNFLSGRCSVLSLSVIWSVVLMVGAGGGQCIVFSVVGGRFLLPLMVCGWCLSNLGGGGALDLYLTGRCPQNPFIFDRFRIFLLKKYPVSQFLFIFSAFKV